MEKREGRDTCDPKETRDVKVGCPKSAGARFKERWLLTRKTWRYMSDAGKKLFPEGAAPQRTEDVPKVEDHFQRVCRRCSDFILWNPYAKKEHADTHRYVASEGESDDEEELHSRVQRADKNARLAFEVGGGVACSTSDPSRERLLSVGDLSRGLPPDVYAHLVKTYDPNTLHSVASRLLEDILMEEDEDDEDEEFIEVDGRLMRSVGSQTEPYLDMCVQTDDDSTAEDFVNIGAETRAQTEAAVAYERALIIQQAQASDQTPLEDSKLDKVVGPYQEETQGQQQQQLAQLQAQQLQLLQQQHSFHKQMLRQIPNQQQPQQKQLQKAQQSQDGGIRPQDGQMEQIEGSEEASAVYPIHLRPRSQSHHHIQVQATDQQLDAILQQEYQPPVLRKFWNKRGSKDETQIQEQMQQEKHSSVKVNKSVAAKLATIEASSPVTPKAQGTSIFAQVGPQSKQPEKKKQNVFKLGLKCSDIEQGQATVKKEIERTKVDKFKTINYDKTLRNIRAKWITSPEDDEFLRGILERNVKECEEFWSKDEIEQKEKEEEKIPRDKQKKKKSKDHQIQVGEPLPQFILTSFRINSPVEIIHATRRRFRRLSSKTESAEHSGSESSLSPTGLTSPRYSITLLDDIGNQDLTVTEGEALKLSRMGIPFSCKMSTGDLSYDPTEVESSKISKVQASSHIAQIFHSLRSSRMTSSFGSSAFGGFKWGKHHRLSHGFLQSLLPTVMQRARTSSAAGHSSRLVGRKLWRARSRSQSRASTGTTSIWTPMGNSTWVSVTNQVSSLEQTTLTNLSELERLTLQKIALGKLQSINLGCSVKVPKDGDSRKRKPYRLRLKKEEAKESLALGASGGIVFGLSLNKCIENERQLQKEAAVKDAIALAAAATTAAAAATQGGYSRKCSRSGSQSSFTSLLEGTKQSRTGSLESLNLERKRPSLGSGEVIPPNASPELLLVEGQPLVPYLVSQCCRHLEDHGIRTLGIFRVSSSKKRVRQLREEFDKGAQVSLGSEHCPHDVAALLKQFFRDLPEPLLTKELYDAFIRTQKIRNRKIQFEALQHLVQLLPAANRDTLHSLLTFLSSVAENSTDSTSRTGEVLPGNRMDSSNLATLFAPNILHQTKPKSETISPSEASTEAENRMDVINVIRSMIDHNKELFEVSPELLDETYQHLMDSHPDALDVLLRRRFINNEDIDLEVDTNSSVFEGSDPSSPLLPRSPTDQVEFEKRKHHIEDEGHKGKGSHEKKLSIDASATNGCLVYREEVSAREMDHQQAFLGGDKQNKYFKRLERSSPKGIEIRKTLDKRRAGTIEIEALRGPVEVSSPSERLNVPEPSVRRLSSPELDSGNVVVGLLKIPVPLSHGVTEQPAARIEETQLSDDIKRRSIDTSHISRQRTGSNDSYLGQPIMGSMSFEPLSKNGEKQSRDSVISSSFYTMSPSDRNTPNSDFHVSGTSTPLSGIVSPPFSPDSGTPGLSPQSSPPPGQKRRLQQQKSDLTSNIKPIPLSHSATHTFGIKPKPPQRGSEKSLVKVPSSTQIARSKTSEMLLKHQAESHSTARSTKEVRRQEISSLRPPITTTQAPLEASRASSSKETQPRRYQPRRYTGEKRRSGPIADIYASSAATMERRIARGDIIASDPTEPETFV